MKKNKTISNSTTDNINLPDNNLTGYEWFKDYYIQTYCLEEKTNKWELAYKIVNELKDKKRINIKTIDEYIKVIDEIINIL